MSRACKTLEAFRATRRRVDDVSAALPALYEDKTPAYVYDEDTVIDILPDGRVSLCIENQIYAGTLAELEKILFEWYQIF